MERFANCREDLLRANSPQAIATLLSDCMGTIGLDLVCSLPANVRHVLTQPTEDIRASAVELFRAELTYAGSREDAILLREIAGTYALAAVRLAQIRKGVADQGHWPAIAARAANPAAVPPAACGSPRFEETRSSRPRSDRPPARFREAGGHSSCRCGPAWRGGDYGRAFPSRRGNRNGTQSPCS